MKQKNQRRIKEQLKMVEKRLANAYEYVTNNVNVEGSSWLHLGDWEGKSGHPLWMQNWMIPCALRYRARKEKALDRIERKAKAKKLTLRKRHHAD
jgi:hypothetical protein